MTDQCTLELFNSILSSIDNTHPKQTIIFNKTTIKKIPCWKSNRADKLCFDMLPPPEDKIEDDFNKYAKEKDMKIKFSTITETGCTITQYPFY